MQIIRDNEITGMIGVSKPILLIDKAEYEADCLKSECFLNEDLFFWDHHFVGNPVMPGTYMLEMLAQSAALMEMLTTGADSVPIIVSITNVRFLREVRPGQTLICEVRVKKKDDQYYTVSGKAYCEGKAVCKAELVHYVKNK